MVLEVEIIRCVRAGLVYSQCAVDSMVTGDMATWGTIALTTTLKTKGRQFDNFVVTGGTVSCRHDNLRCHQWRQSCQIDDLLFSVNDFINRSAHILASQPIGLTRISSYHLRKWLTYTLFEDEIFSALPLSLPVPIRDNSYMWNMTYNDKVVQADGCQMQNIHMRCLNCANVMKAHRYYVSLAVGILCSVSTRLTSKMWSSFGDTQRFHEGTNV